MPAHRDDCNSQLRDVAKFSEGEQDFFVVDKDIVRGNDVIVEIYSATSFSLAASTDSFFCKVVHAAKHFGAPQRWHLSLGYLCMVMASHLIRTGMLSQNAGDFWT